MKTKVSMKVRILLFIAGIVLCLKIALRSSPSVLATDLTAGLDEETARAIRQATLQLALYEYDRGQGVEVGGRGLGTLVQRNGERLIVTHDHWTHLNGNLHEVVLRDADGRLLLTLAADRFRTLIRYRDRGTLILAAPAELAGMPAAAPADGVAGEGDTVWVAQRTGANGDVVQVAGAVVDGTVAADGPARLQLRGENGAAVVPGDSGGGIWLGAQLVANVWSGGVEVHTTWLGRLLERSEPRTSNLIVGALVPVIQDEPGAAATGAAHFTQSTPAAGRANLPEQ